jgi:hypothetical protein
VQLEIHWHREGTLYTEGWQIFKFEDEAE